MNQLPTYEGLLIELYGTLESLSVYSKSENIKETAVKRLKELNHIRKIGSGFQLDKEIGAIPPAENIEERLSTLEQEFIMRRFEYIKKRKGHVWAEKEVLVYMVSKYPEIKPSYWHSITKKINENGNGPQEI